MRDKFGGCPWKSLACSEEKVLVIPFVAFHWMVCTTESELVLSQSPCFWHHVHQMDELYYEPIFNTLCLDSFLYIFQVLFHVVLFFFHTFSNEFKKRDK